MGTFRNLMLILGMFFSVVVIALAIGMCFPGFRQSVCTTFQVVPTSTYVSVSDTLTEKETELSTLIMDKISLQNQIRDLEEDADENADLIEDYLAQIDELNNQIVALTLSINGYQVQAVSLNNRITELENSTCGMSIEYLAKHHNIQLPIYDSMGNFSYTNSYSDSNEQAYTIMGNYLRDNWSYYLNNIIDSVTASIENNYDLSTVKISEYDVYKANLGDKSSTFGFFVNEYYVASNVTFDYEIYVNDVAVDMSDMVNIINPDINYLDQSSISYTLNANNKITSISILFKYWEE